MNERIKEFAKECTEWVTGTIDGDYEYFDKEKFALLIVQECANKQLSLAANYEAVSEGYEPAFPEFVDGTINGLKEGAELIKQHFGVDNK